MHARIQKYWCRSSIFRHLKLELLTQFPASNDEKYINVVYIWRQFVSFYGYVHWWMTTEISVMYGGEKVKKHYFNVKCQRLDVCKFTFLWIILRINPLSAEIDIRHQNLTSVYVKKFKVQVYSLISSISYQVWHLHFYPLVTGPVDLCVIPTLRKSDSFAAISAHWTYHPHCHLCPTSYLFSPDLSEAVEG